MDFITIMKSALDSGGLVALAIFAIWMLDRAHRERVKVEMNYRETITMLTNEVIQVVKENTAAVTRLCEK